MRKVYLLVVALTLGFISKAQVSITTLGVANTQNFDGLGTANFNLTDNTSITGVYAFRTTGNVTPNVITVDNGGSNAGRFDNYGTTGASDRALGSVGSGGTGTLYYGVRYKNNTGSTITSLTVTYTGEQWRNGGNTSAQPLTFDYRQAATVTDLTTGTYTSVAALTFNTLINTLTAAALDGNLAANRTTLSTTITVNIPTGEEVMLRWSDINDSGNDHGVSIDDLSVTAIGGAPTPNITVSATSLTSFGAIVFGNNSAERTYDVSGSNLGGDISVIAPADVEVSLSSTFTGITGNTLTLTPVSGTVAATTIHARFSPAAASGTLNTNITNGSTGATTRNVNVQGYAVDVEPTVQSTISFGAITDNSITVNFSGGNGEGRLLVAKAATAVNADPADGPIYFDGGGIFTNGTDLGTGNYVVYVGAGNTVDVTGLTAGTQYHFAIYEFNHNVVGGSYNYLAPGGIGNATTTTPPVGLQLSAVNTAYTITFDNTIANSNTGSFNGTNINTTDAAGSLNSNAWAINDLSATAPAVFGQTYTGGGLQAAGAYASSNFFGMNIGAGDVALAVQPTGSYFSPGNITLRLQNQTGAPLTKLNLSYIVYVVNDQDRGNTFNFAYSTDNATYTNQTALDYTSVAALQNTTLRPQYRSTEITGLNVPAGGFVYLRWYGDDAGGTGSRDEFALDNVEIIANATSVAPTISGTPENVVINTGTTATGAVTISGNLNLVSGLLTIGSNNITAGTVSGGSATAYVVTNGTGSLTINNVGASNVVFPVGPSASLYHPATLNNAGTPDNFSVRVSSTSPVCLPPLTSVNANWEISEGTAGGSNCTISLDYTGASTGASYDPLLASIVHCGGTAYHNGTVSGTVATGSGFTEFSPFGISSDAGILPVNFTNFKAYQQGNAVKIDWSNLSESNVAGYRVERSADGVSFTTLTTVSPTRNDGSRADYSVLDQSPMNGANFYRIQATEASGKVYYTTIIKVNTKGDNTGLLIYPNPVTGRQLSFQATALPKGDYSIRIFNASGQQLSNQTLRHSGGFITQTITLPAGIGTGMFSLRVIGEEVNITRQFIIR